MAMYQVQMVNNVKTLVPVSGDVSTNSVTDNDMHPVTSNAVASLLNTNQNDTGQVDISNQVTKSMGASRVYAFRENNMGYILIEGEYTGGYTTGTQDFISNLPSKYIPRFTQNITLQGYSTSAGGAVFSRGTIETSGKIRIQESSWPNMTQIRVGFTYII